MKKRALYLLLALPLLAGCNTMMDCTEGNGIVTTDSRTTELFNEVLVEGSFEVILKRGTNPSVVIEADSNLHSQILATVKSDELTLSTKGCVEASKPIRITVTAPAYQVLEVNGSGSITSPELISADDELELTVDGSGKIDLDVHAGTVTSELDGSGSITLRGGAQGQKVDMSGSGNYTAPDLLVKETVVKISGSGNAEVNSQAALTVDISGSGNVRYKGAPQKLNSNISGSGKLVQE